MKTKLKKKNIPDGWDYATLRESGVAVIDGDRGKNYPKQNDFTRHGHCLFLNTSNVSKKGFNFEGMQFISPDKDRAMGKGKLARQDLIITTRGTIGNIAFYSNDIKYDHVRINSGMAIIRNENGYLLTKYLLKYFLSAIFVRELKRVSFGSAQPQLTIQLINKFKVPHCPLPEQKRIVGVLGVWDAYLERLVKKIELKKRIKKGLMQQLLTGKRRLKGFTEPLETIKLGNLTEVITKGTTPTTHGFAYQDKGVSFIKVESLSENGRLLREKTAYISPEAHTFFKRSQLKNNDILFSIAGALGRVYKVNNDCLPANTNQALAIIRLNSKTAADLCYTYLYLKSDVIKNWVKNINVQAAQANISLKDIANIVLQLPVLKEQAAIADILTKADDEIAALEKKKQILEAQKKYLLNNLIAGYIRTPENLLEGLKDD